MMLNGWAALAIIVVVLAVGFLIFLMTATKHEERMLWLKIEELKFTIEKNRREHTKNGKKKIGRKKKENK